MPHTHDFIRQTIFVNGIGSGHKVVCFICGKEA